MTLSAVEQAKFRAYIANRLMREILLLIPEYIQTNAYLIEDIEDKSYESVVEEYVKDAFQGAFTQINFHSTRDPYWGPRI